MNNNINASAQAQEDKSEIQKILMSEQAIIGAVLSAAKKDKVQLINEVFDTVKPTDFRIDEHKVIFEAISKIHTDGSKPDATLVFQSLTNSGFSDKRYGEYVFRIAAQAENQIDENYQSHLDIVRNYGTLKELALIGQEIESVAKCGSSSEEVYEKATNLLSSVQRNTVKTTHKIDDLLEGFIDIVDKRFNGTQESLWKTGFEDLDEAMNIEAGDMVVLAGRPSMGKTTIALNMATNWIKNGIPTLVISMEMSKDQIIESFVASVGKVEIKKMKKGTLQQEDWPGFNKGLTFLNDKELMISEDTFLTASSLTTVIENAVSEHGVKAVVIDYLQLIEGEKGSQNRSNDVSKISRTIKRLAKKFGLCILALSQLNRGLEQRQNKRPVMSDLRESGAIEQDADKIIFIYRDEVYNPDSDEVGTAEIIGEKNRGGKKFNVRLSTELQYGLFKDFAFKYQNEY